MSTPNPEPRRSYWELCHEEPFRIFFPLGILVGVSGVSLWPLFFSGLHRFYPGVMHARLTIEGFAGAFVIGFLGTAGPRLTDTGSLSRFELRILLALYAACVGIHVGERPWLGDAFFVALIIFFAVSM